MNLKPKWLSGPLRSSLIESDLKYSVQLPQDPVMPATQRGQTGEQHREVKQQAGIKQELLRVVKGGCFVL